MNYRETFQSKVQPTQLMQTQPKIEAIVWGQPQLSQSHVVKPTPLIHILAQPQPQLDMGQPQIAHTQLIQPQLAQLTSGQEQLLVGQASVSGDFPQFNKQIHSQE